ncbi:hypothetical protein [Paenibacillus sp. FSL H3-0469]|uniref:hypothetical protein n=1 Tax=Paenibacillus sp. FSL H3-0469 TaxID=2954506 RepID=UPI0031019F10
MTNTDLLSEVIPIAANFNIVIYSRDIIDPDKLLRIVRDKGFAPAIKQIESIRNWEYEDSRTLTIQGMLTDPLTALLEEGRIILIQGEAKLNRFVVLLSKSEEVYETRISIDTRHIDYLDDTLNERNQPFYDALSNLLLSSELSNDFLVAALGVEVVVDYHTDPNKMMRNSHNVLKWVFKP